MLGRIATRFEQEECIGGHSYEGEWGIQKEPPAYRCISNKLDLHPEVVSSLELCTAIREAVAKNLMSGCF